MLKALFKQAGAGFLNDRFDSGRLPLADMIENEISGILSGSVGPIGEMCGHIFTAGGKRIRPLLVAYSGLVFGEMKPELVSAAVAAEFIHMASLVHDDIIDESGLRRGKPSVNKHWGNRYAVLCGDYLFARAFSILSQKRLLKSLNYMVEAIENMCGGEIQQAEERFETDTGLEKYYDRIMKKTAIFLQCCCKSGAATAGADERQIGIIGEFGMNLGLAFQIIDDILDYCGDEALMGKPGGEDFLQGNITLPIILLMRNEKYRAPVKSLFGQKNPDSSSVREITGMLKMAGAIDETFSIASAHIKDAEQCLEMLPGTRYTEYLYKMTGMLKSRLN